MKNILIADHSRLMREILTKAISTDENIQIIKTVENYEHLSELVKKQDIDWIIITSSVDEQLPVEVKELLIDHPEIGVLAVSPDGSHICLKWFTVHERDLDGLSLDEVTQILSNDILLEEN